MLKVDKFILYLGGYFSIKILEKNTAEVFRSNYGWKFPASIYYKAIIVNFEQISYIVMVFPLLTLNK